MDPLQDILKRNREDAFDFINILFSNVHKSKLLIFPRPPRPDEGDTPPGKLLQPQCVSLLLFKTISPAEVPCLIYQPAPPGGTSMHAVRV